MYGCRYTATSEDLTVECGDVKLSGKFDGVTTFLTKVNSTPTNIPLTGTETSTITCFIIMYHIVKFVITYLIIVGKRQSIILCQGIVYIYLSVSLHYCILHSIARRELYIQYIKLYTLHMNSSATVPLLSDEPYSNTTKTQIINETSRGWGIVRGLNWYFGRNV